MRSDEDPIISRQLPVIEKIIEDETWLEGERRRSAVSPQDPAVLSNVCDVILRIGGDLRTKLSREARPAAGCEPMESTSLHEAA